MPESAENIPETGDSPRKPEFIGRTFTIEFLSLSPNGLEIQTLKSLPRHSPNTPLPYAKEIAQVRSREDKARRIGPNFRPLVGLRNISQAGDALAFDIIPVTYPTYRALSQPEDVQGAERMGMHASTAMILETTESDGSSKLIVQHRSTKNALYGDIPGASIAGGLDGTLRKNRENKGTLEPIDTQTIKANILNEANEEFGLSDQDLQAIKITGLAKDLVRLHYEFLLVGVTNLNTSQIAERIEEKQRAKNPESPYDFTEEFFTIDATPDAIEKLLTQVKCPLPSTHSAAFVAAGYLMVIEKNGLEEAKKWKSKIEQGIKDNYQEIDEMVDNYYKTDPRVLKNEPKGKRNPVGYEPAYFPQEQGLPSLTLELERVGLI